jgi:chaperonin GroES
LLPDEISFPSPSPKNKEFLSEIKMVLMTLRRFASADVLRKFIPLFDRVLVEKLTPESKTKGGIMIPEKAQGKVLEATVVSVGEGGRAENGTTVPMSIKSGDRVLLPEYGGTKVIMDDKDYFIYRESDIMGKWMD